MPSKSTLILVLVIILFVGGFGAAIVDSLSGDTKSPTPTFVDQQVFASLSATPTISSSTSAPQASTPVPLQEYVTFENAKYDCRKINNPSEKGVDLVYPTIMNAFRAIEAAGNPTVWEPGPYLFIPFGGSPSLKQQRSEMDLTHNGDRVCVLSP